MKWFGKKNKDEDFLDLAKEPLPSGPIDSTSTIQPDNTTAKLDLLNTRLQNIEAKLERIESLLKRPTEPSTNQDQPSNSPVKW